MATDGDDDVTRSGMAEISSEDVIMISSSEGNTNECNTDPGVLVSNSLAASEDFQSNSQHSNTQPNVETAKNAVIETIELLDSDSEGMVKNRLVSPIVHRK